MEKLKPKKYSSMLILIALMIIIVFATKWSFNDEMKEKVSQTEKLQNKEHPLESQAAHESKNPIDIVVANKTLDTQSKRGPQSEKKEAPDWAETLKERLMQHATLTHFRSIDIELIKPVVLKRNHYEISAHKVLIKIIRTDGLKSSYNALINTKTGSIIQTWNRPHYEDKERMELSPVGRGLSSED